MRALTAVLALAFLATGCRASFNGREPLAYPCSRDAGSAPDSGPDSDGQCPGGWVCGLEGRCHGPDAGAPYLCETDRDCTPGWRCGLEATCHLLDAGAAYLCRTDVDCEGGWRCGPAGTCLEGTEADALRPGPGALSLAPLYPAAPGRGPDLFATSYPSPQPGASAQAFAFSSGDRLYAGVQVRGDGSGLTVASVASDTADLTGLGVKALGVAGPAVLLLRDAGLGTAVFPPAGGAPVVTPNAYSTVAADEVRITRGADPLAFAFSGSSYWVLRVDGGLTAASFLGPDAGPRLIRDVADLQAGACPAGLVVASDEVVGFAPRTANGSFLSPDGGPAPTPGPAWQLGDVAAVLGGAGPGWSAKLLRTLGDDAVAVAGGVDGGLAVVVASVVRPDGGCADRLLLARQLGPCPVCPVGEAVIDFQPLSASSEPMVLSRCRSADRERTTLLTRVAGGGPSQCYRQQLQDSSSLYGEPVQPARAAAGAPAYAGGHGQVWLSGGQWPPVPLVPDQPPLFVARSPASGSGAPSTLLGMGPGFWVLADDGGYPAFAPFAASAVKPAAVVAGRPSWVLAPPALVIDLGQNRWVATPEASLQGLGAPLSGTVVATPDGGAELVVAANDTLLGADVTRGGGELSWRLVPLPGAPIRALVAAPARPATDGGTAPWFEGYLLAQDRLFALTGETDRHWSADELPVPDGEPVALWLDGPRGRLGLRDGRVLSLPLRVPLAPLLPGKEAADFAQVCGQGYALSAEGLFRLDADAQGGPVGRWTRVELSGLIPGGADGGDLGLDRGRLLTLDNELYVFSRFGGAARLAGPANCP